MDKAEPVPLPSATTSTPGRGYDGGEPMMTDHEQRHGCEEELRTLRHLRERGTVTPAEAVRVKKALEDMAARRTGQLMVKLNETGLTIDAEPFED